MRPRCRRSLPTRRRRLPPSRHPTAPTSKHSRTTARSKPRNCSRSRSRSRTHTSATRPVRCRKATQPRRLHLRCRLRRRPTLFSRHRFRLGSRVLLPTLREPLVSNLSHLRRVRSQGNGRTRSPRLRLRRRRRLPLPMVNRLLRARRTPARRLLPARSTRPESP